MKITESIIRESIEKNIDTFRSKALRGGVDGQDVADLFGFGDVYSEAVKEEEEFNEIREAVYNKLNEEEPSFGVEDDETSDDETSDDETSDDEETSDEIEDNTEEAFDASSIKDFLTKTNTKVKITLVSSEPSPIFGPNDKNNHNKYKITISNEKGSVWFFYWDSIYNTENGKTPTEEDVVSCFAKDVSATIDGISLEEFKSMFGYDEADNNLAQKAYEGCRKMVERAKKLFDDEQIEKLIELSNEY